MKYLFFALTIFIAGCTDNSSLHIERLENLQRETQTNLVSCQNQLEAARGSTYGGFNNPEPVAEEPTQPEYEEVEYAQLQGKSHRCYEREVEACGMTFAQCSDGYVYRCMKDAVYKIGTEQKLIEQE